MSAYETVVGLLYEVKDWGREECLTEVLEWIDKNYYKFSNKEEMIEEFKKKFF